MSQNCCVAHNTAHLFLRCLKASARLANMWSWLGFLICLGIRLWGSWFRLGWPGDWALLWVTLLLLLGQWASWTHPPCDGRSTTEQAPIVKPPLASHPLLSHRLNKSDSKTLRIKWLEGVLSFLMGGTAKSHGKRHRHREGWRLVDLFFETL